MEDKQCNKLLSVEEQIMTKAPVCENVCKFLVLLRFKVKQNLRDWGILYTKLNFLMSVLSFGSLVKITI